MPKTRELPYPAEMAAQVIASMCVDDEVCGEFYRVPTIRHWRGSWWHWESGHYSEMTPPSWLDDKIITRWPQSTSRDWDEVHRVMRARLALRDDIGMPCWLEAADGDQKVHKLMAPNDYLAMASGLVRPRLLARGDREHGWSPHSPRWFSCTRLEYDYDPADTCPFWESWLQHVMEGDSERIAMLQEFMGYLLVPDLSRQVILVLYGDGATGKSTVLKVMRALLGPQNCFPMQVSSFGSRFAIADTLGKSLVYLDEVSKPSPEAQETMKWFVSDIEIRAERKFQVKSQSCRPTAKLVMSLNTWPKFPDQSDGWYRRLLVLPMRVRNETQDPGLSEKLTANVPGIFNWALAGLHRLESRGFTQPAVSVELEREIREDNQSPHEFLNQVIEPDVGSRVSYLSLAKEYASWCESRGIQPATLSHVALGRMAKFQIKGTSQGRWIEQPYGKVTGLLGVRLKPQSQEIQNA